MNKKVRILGIAPYKGLKTLMDQYARKRDDISLTTIIGNMEDGVKIALENYNDFDIIISRANTANMISHAVPVTVIDIGIGFYDILRCIKMAENTNTKFALLGFPSLTKIAHTLCDLLKIHLDIYPIHSYEEASKVIDSLKSMGYQTIICDVVSYGYAKEIGLTPFLLTTSIESLESAIETAVKSWHTNQRMYESVSMMKNVLSTSLSRYLILDTDGMCLYSTLHDFPTSEIQECLVEEIPECRRNKKRSFFITLNNQMYSILANYIENSDNPYIIFRIMRSEIPLSHSKYGINFMDKKSAELSFYNHFFSNTSYSKEILENAEVMNSSSTSIMITGEIGTGKDYIAQIYYAKGIFGDNPLYIVNCAFLNEKSWQFITNSYNSPFTDNGNTIYISNLDSLTREKQKQLLSIILDTNVHIRNRLIFSCSKAPNQPLPHAATEYTNVLGSILLLAKPLRDQKEDLLAAAGFYINRLNQQLGKQVVGLDEEAAALLMDYDYPYNRMQFKRILKNAVLHANSSYLGKEAIHSAIEQEHLLVQQAPHGQKESTNQPQPKASENDELNLNLDQPLDAINRSIIQYTLKKCSGNQSAAAKKLGISRTTLWRYLNR